MRECVRVGSIHLNTWIQFLLFQLALSFEYGLVRALVRLVTSMEEANTAVDISFDDFILYLIKTSVRENLTDANTLANAPRPATP